MSQPAPKANFLQTLLIMTVVFLGFQLWQGSQKPPVDPRSPQDIMRAIEKDAAEIRDLSAKNQIPVAQAIKLQLETKKKLEFNHDFPNLPVKESYRQLLLNNELGTELSMARLVPSFETKVDAQKKLGAGAKDGLTIQQAREYKVAAKSLLAHTQYKAAVQRQDFQRIIPAHESMSGLAKEYSKDPVWSKAVGTSKTGSLAGGELTPEQLTKIIDEASYKLGKETPVWGFFPGYQFIDFLVNLSGANAGFSYALAAFLLALCVRAIVFPLAQRQMMWGRQMSQLTPLVNEIKEQFKGKTDQASQQEQQKRILALYQEYGINPMAGCAPALLQMPLFLIIYQSMLHYRFEFQKGLFLWISPGGNAATNGFVAANLGQKDYILIVLYGISMVATTLLTPISDPANAKQQRTMGVSIAVLFSVMMFFWPVPSAFVLYWVFTNILATAQSLRAYRLPLPPLAKKIAPPVGSIRLTRI